MSRSVGKHFSREFGELEDTLQQRMKVAEDTIRALNSAQDALHTESIIQTSRSSTPNRDRPGLGSSLRSPGGAASALQSNDLRAQIRGVVGDLQMVEAAAGGSHADIVRMCQLDMERLAHLRSVVELEMEKMELRALDSTGQFNDVSALSTAQDRQAVTLTEALLSPSNFSTTCYAHAL